MYAIFVLGLISWYRRNPATKQFDNGIGVCSFFSFISSLFLLYVNFNTGTILIGDQSDPAFWNSIRDRYHVDIFLDDGGHTMNMQRTTFEHVFEMIDVNGLYVCEDLATSYVTQFGGLPGITAPKSVLFTMIGLTQQFVDWINGYFVDGIMPSMQPGFGDNSLASDFTKSVKGVYFYSQLVVVESDEDKSPWFSFFFYVSLGGNNTNVTGTVLSGGRSIPYVSSQPWNGKGKVNCIKRIVQNVMG